MNEIITIHEDNNDFPVNGRELHKSLGVSTPYHIWFPRMCEYGFEKGKDYQEVMNKFVQNTDLQRFSGRPSVDHSLTLAMAKEICMLQRSEQGREVRRYLIAVESAWNTPEMVFARALKYADKRLAEVNEHVAKLEGQIQQDAPYTQFGRGLSENTGSVKVRDFAKALNNGGIQTGEKRLYAWMRGNGYLQADNMPYQRYVDMGLFDVRMIPMTINGVDRIAKTTYITGKGQQYFFSKLSDRAM